MLASALVTLLTASALLASAASRPTTDSESPEAKEGGVLTCQEVITAPMGFVLETVVGPLSFIGPKTEDGDPILHATRASGEPVPLHEFTFKACKSNKAKSFMGEPTAPALALGQLEWAETPGKCVTANLPAIGQGGMVHAQYLLADCSPGDDSGQLLQTFSITEDGYVDFVGHRQGAKPYYVSTISKRKYTNILVKKARTPTQGLRFKFAEG